MSTTLSRMVTPHPRARSHPLIGPGPRAHPTAASGSHARHHGLHQPGHVRLVKPYSTAALPALDGGRIVFVLIEAVRGRRISPEREAVFHFVGLIILVSMMAFVMLQDLINPIIPWSLLR